MESLFYDIYVSYSFLSFLEKNDIKSTFKIENEFTFLKLNMIFVKNYSYTCIIRIRFIENYEFSYSFSYTPFRMLRLHFRNNFLFDDTSP